MTSPIAVGTRAPDFRAPSSHGQTLDLDSFRGKVPVVLVFPDPDRPREQLHAFDDGLVDFGRRRVQLLFVMPATSRELRDLADREDLALPLLADADGSIAESFGARGDQAYVLGADGLLAAVCPVTSGPSSVLAFLDGSGPDLGSEPHPEGGRTLDREGIPDLDGPLPGIARTGDPEEGSAPPGDRPRASVDSGVTEAEQLRGESLDRRLGREQADVVRPADELPPTLVGTPILDDDEKDLIATDAGTDPTLGMSAEELAIHVVDEP